MSQMVSDREYLGDGVYAEFDGFQIWLAANDGIRDYARIALETSVMHALQDYRQRLNKTYGTKHL
jgi:hypothetical protein